MGGNLVSVTAPKAGLSSVSCPGTTSTPFTTVYGYDADHRLTSVTNPQTQDLLNHQTLFAYDQNSNRTQVTDANGKATTFTYDALNRLIQVEQPFVIGHPVISRTQYDANGNVTLQISPRAYDAAPAPKLSFANYVTGFHYDQLNRMVRQDLPVGPSAPDNVPFYVHRAYDANGNLVSSSLPVATSDPSQVAPTSQTQLTYFDPGWVAVSQDPGQSPHPLRLHGQGRAGRCQRRLGPEQADQLVLPRRRHAAGAQGPAGPAHHLHL